MFSPHLTVIQKLGNVVHILKNHADTISRHLQCKLREKCIKLMPSTATVPYFMNLRIKFTKELN